MEVYIHKDTGKGWILIEELEDGSGYFVSPAPRKMQRPFDEFKGEEETDENVLIKKGIISKEQTQIYHLYRESRKDEIRDKVFSILQELVDEIGKEEAIKVIDDSFNKENAEGIKTILFKDKS
ncbi:MAG: hypothetical protein KQI78_12265 [Deltaproteobacteria bacterium]|nr:hypothetical protein [Deltaproteobacteria bacterium]